MRYPVLHAGVMTDGRIVTSRGNGKVYFIDDGASADVMRVRGARVVETGASGGKWLAVPGMMGHQVIAKLGSGKKITAEMAGLVYNDAELVDSLCGVGTYERVMPYDEVEILQLARPLYQ